MSLAEPREQPVKRTVVLAGATGLVGRSIPEGLWRIHRFGRFMCWRGASPRRRCPDHMPHRGFRGDTPSSARR